MPRLARLLLRHHPPPSAVALRRAGPDDAALIVGWRGEASARRFQPLRPASVDDVRALLAQQAKRTVDPRLVGDTYWIVEAGREPIGRVSLADINREHGRAEVGCLIGERHQGRGYGTAALRALDTLALDPGTIDLWRLEALVAVGNVASRRMVERVGFRCEGTARAYWRLDGEWTDVARYALLRSDWQAGGAAADSD